MSEFQILLKGSAESIFFSILGIAVMILCFVVVSRFSDFSLKKELIEDENIAIGIMFAGFFISVAIIIASAIKG